MPDIMTSRIGSRRTDPEPRFRALPRFCRGSSAWSPESARVSNSSTGFGGKQRSGAGHCRTGTIFDTGAARHRRKGRAMNFARSRFAAAAGRLHARWPWRRRAAAAPRARARKARPKQPKKPRRAKPASTSSRPPSRRASAKARAKADSAKKAAKAAAKPAGENGRQKPAAKTAPQRRARNHHRVGTQPASPRRKLSPTADPRRQRRSRPITSAAAAAAGARRSVRHLAPPAAPPAPRSRRVHADGAVRRRRQLRRRPPPTSRCVKQAIDARPPRQDQPKPATVQRTIGDPLARKLVEWTILRSDEQRRRLRPLRRLHRRQSELAERHA